MSVDPLLSIIIATYNASEFFEECLESIDREWDDRIELVLVDGLSSDGTVSIAKKYSHRFSHVLIEKDDGQSDAFNKGFSLAKGEYVSWVNADDVLVPGALARVLDVLEQRESEWYAANQIYIDDSGRIVKFAQIGGFESFGVRFGVLHVFGPSTFIKRELFARMGPFDVEFLWIQNIGGGWRRMGLCFKEYLYIFGRLEYIKIQRPPRRYREMKFQRE